MPLSDLSYYQRAYGQFDPDVSLSGNGRFLAYASQSGIVLVDTISSTTRLVGDALNLNFAPALSGDGSKVVFTTQAPGGLQQIALASVADGSVTIVTLSANGDSRAASVSADGRYIAFESAASNLVENDTNNADDVFVMDMLTGAVRCVSLDGPAMEAQISADGNVVLFKSIDSLALYARKLDTGALSLVSPNADHARLSADGRYVVFSSTAQPGSEVLRMDLSTGELARVSEEGSAWNAAPSISADGRFVSFASDGGTTGNQEIYLRDMSTGTLVQLSHGMEPGQGSYEPAISADGSGVAFVTYAGTLGENYDVTWDVALATLGESAAAPVVAAAMAIAGSDGLDVVTYQGRLADYSVDTSGDTVLVNGAERGTFDALTDIERLQFSDTMYALAADDVAGQAYRIYQAAFNRSPDAAGIGFWIGAMDAGVSLESVAAGFVASSEFSAMYANASGNGAIVDRLYQNVLHRAGEAAGLAFWTNALDSGAASLAQVLAAFSESPENIAALVGVLEDGFAYLPFG
jgi:Tol biopolymer transport system component